MESTDVLILGGGMAGAAAALACAAAGAAVTLVRAAPGATALAAGGWIGTPPAAVLDALARAGLPLMPCSGPLPHPDGSLRAFDMAPASHDAAAFSARPALVCGITGLPAFRSDALARLWSAAAALPPGAVTSARVTLPQTPAGGWAPLSLASYIQREPHHLAAAVRAAAQEHGSTHVILPAVLGVHDHARVHQEIAEAAGVHIGEALGTAPSLPGWRLDTALLRLLADAGVALVTGRATASAGSGGRVEEVTVAGDVVTARYRAASVILATGKFTGGGIAAASVFREAVFGFDVPAERFGRTFTESSDTFALTDPARTEPQPVLALGVRTNADMHPISASGDVAYSNVFVAGTIRAGTETASFGLGHAAQEGWRAGTRAIAAHSN